MIIDAHAHYGHDHVFDEDNSIETLVQWCDRYNIDHAIIQPSIPRPYIGETAKVHNEIHAICGQSDGRFFGMASINPHFKPDEYDQELRRCVRELGFVSVKITPIGHAANPSSVDCMHAYEICEALGIPVMIHTGAGAPFADPLNMLAPAKAFPRVKFVMAHAGTDSMFAAALYVARLCGNVYLEPSWLNVYSLKEAVEELGADRVMFASDMPMNIPVELAKYHAITDDPSVLSQLLSGTAAHVFGLNL